MLRIGGLVIVIFVSNSVIKKSLVVMFDRPRVDFVLFSGLLIKEEI